MSWSPQNSWFLLHQSSGPILSSDLMAALQQLESGSSSSSDSIKHEHTEWVCFIYIFYKDNPCPVSKDPVHFQHCLTDCNGSSSLTFTHIQAWRKSSDSGRGRCYLLYFLCCSWINKEDAQDSATYQTHTKTHAPATVWPSAVYTNTHTFTFTQKHTQCPTPLLFVLIAAPGGGQLGEMALHV